MQQTGKHLRGQMIRTTVMLLRECNGKVSGFISYYDCIVFISFFFNNFFFIFWPFMALLIKKLKIWQETGRERGRVTRSKEVEPRSAAEPAEAHGTCALPTELNGAPHFIYFYDRFRSNREKLWKRWNHHVCFIEQFKVSRNDVETQKGSENETDDSHGSNSEHIYGNASKCFIIVLKVKVSL